MLKTLAIFFASILLMSCGGNKNFTAFEGKNPANAKAFAPPKDERLLNIAEHALKFEGTRYKYGGTTRKGMDCSGLVYVSFLSENIQLPRVSRYMANEGKMLHVNQINVGDLLFFQTNKNKDVINHVGLVVEIVPGSVNFIHSTTSRGVIVSSLNERYWNDAFVVAKRVL